ncbi:MAG: hypothetical protein ABR604_00915 [Jatrophihabitantaceae bacterium]
MAPVLMTSHPTVATLRLPSKAPFVLPFGGSYDTTLMGINSTATVGADARVKTMQDRPPRGVPR